MPISGPFFLSLWFPKKIFDLSTGTFTTEHNITPNDRGWTAGRPIKTWKRPITPTDCDRLRLPPETKALRFARLVLCYFSFFFCFLFFSFFRARASSHFRLLFSWGEEGRGAENTDLEMMMMIFFVIILTDWGWFPGNGSWFN